MNPMDLYIVTLNKLPEGKDEKSPFRKSPEEIRAYTERAQQHYHEVRERLKAEGYLNSITVTRILKIAGTMFIHGPQDAIDRLQKYLTDNDLGGLCKNCEVYPATKK